MKKYVLLLIYLIIPVFLFAQWSGIGSTAGITNSDLVSGVSGSYFTQIAPIANNSSFMTKDTILSHVMVNDTGSSTTLFSLGIHSGVTKGDLSSVGAIACGGGINTWDFLGIDPTGASQYAYVTLGTTNGSASVSYSAAAGTGYGRLGLYYGGNEIAQSSYTNASGSFSFSYAYNSTIGQYGYVKYDSIGSTSTPPDFSITDVGCPTGSSPTTTYLWVHYSGGFIYVDCRTADNGGGSLTTISCAQTISVSWTSTDYPSGTSGSLTLPANTSTTSAKLDPGGTINSITSASYSPGCSGYNIVISYQ